MKTHLLLVAGILFPGFLFCQGVVQKQTYTQTSNTTYQSRTNQGGGQTVNANSTYHPQQNSQSTSTSRYSQQQSQQTNNTVRQDNLHVQNGYHANNKNLNADKTISSTESNLDKGKNISGLSQMRKPDDSYLSGSEILTTKDIHLNRKGSVGKPNVLVNFLDDPNITYHPTGAIPVTYFKSKSYKSTVISPAQVYYLKPGLRLKVVGGDVCELKNLDGFGVHIACFANYKYCESIAKWLRNKYKATFYILEDSYSYNHYHLVFGRWLSFKTAEIFEGKVRRNVPWAFVFPWNLDADFLKQVPYYSITNNLYTLKNSPIFTK